MRATSRRPSSWISRGLRFERRIFAEHRPVIGLAFGQIARGDSGARTRHIVLGEHGVQPPVGRHRRLLDGRHGRVSQRYLQLARYVRGHRDERRVERIGFVAVEERFHRPVAPGQGHARDRETAGETGAHVGDILVEVAREVVKPSDIALIFRGIGETRARREIGPEEGIGVERGLVGAEAHVVRLLLDQRPEHRRVDPFLPRELGDRDPVELGQHALPVSEPRLLRRRINARKVIRQGTGPRSGQVAEFGHLPLPRGSVEPAQPFVGRLRRLS